MKRSFLVNVVALSLILTLLGGVGCRRGIKGPTPIPSTQRQVKDPNAANPLAQRNIPDQPIIPQDTLTARNLPETTNGIPQGDDMTKWEGRPADTNIFKAYTVYFEFDSSAIRASERSKLEAVADHMKKATAEYDLAIEGHCDERGTEEYNRALGERRALACREYLVNLGLGANRINTKSFGENRPVDPEHTEAAWAKNRRCEFILLLPRAANP